MSRLTYWLTYTQAGAVERAVPWRLLAVKVDPCFLLLRPTNWLELVRRVHQIRGLPAASADSMLLAVKAGP